MGVSDLPTCIYCSNEADSHEHWLPRGLGTFRGNTTLVNQVCGDCNHCLGRLDEELLRTGHTGFVRQLLGVRGRHGASTVSPYQYRVMRAEQPTTTMMLPAIGRDHQIHGETYTDAEGRPSARPIRQVVLRMPDGSMQSVPFPRPWTADHLRQAVVNRGLETGTLQELYLEDDEVFTDQESPDALDIRTLLSSVFGGGFRADVYGGDGERTRNRLVTVAGVNTAYLRALAKVAFHYLLWACPIFRGNDQLFAEIRAFILDGAGNSQDFVQLDAPQFLPVLQRGCRPERTSHFFHSAVTHDAATAFVQFFVGPCGLPPPARVRLAVNPLLLGGQFFTCHQACYFAGDDDDQGHQGELVTIDTWERRIITPLLPGSG